MEKNNLKFKKTLIIITYSLFLAFILLNLKGILTLVGSFLKVLSPLWIGLILAFVLNVPMSIIENKFFKRTNTKIRIVSLLAAILILLLLLLILFVWVIPDFIKSITYLIGEIPNLINSLNAFLINTFSNTSISSYLNDFTGDSKMANLFSSSFSSIITNLTTILSNFATFLINIVTGIIIAIYFLLEKEKILYNIKLTISKLFEKTLVKKINSAYKLINKTFHDFITYQCLECLILGVLMFISYLILGFPYALTIAFLTTVTAIIPIFGATVAMIIGFILIATKDIKLAILFIVDFQVIQQIENNLIYPKVVGKNVGLPPVITIISLIVFGKFGGLLGMLVCVPVTAIIYTLFIKYINSTKVEKIKLPSINIKD